MPQPISFGPFEKFDDGHEFRTDPNAFLHLLGVQNLAPSSPSCLRQIHERTLVGDKRLQLLVNHPARCWHKSVSYSGDVVQILSAIVADDDRIDAVRSGNKSANHEFLALVAFLKSICREIPSKFNPRIF